MKASLSLINCLSRTLRVSARPLAFACLLFLLENGCSLALELLRGRRCEKLSTWVDSALREPRPHRAGPGAFGDLLGAAALADPPPCLSRSRSSEATGTSF